MLVLSRGVDEEIMVGENIVVRVLAIKGNTVRLGLVAPREVRILRGELVDDIEPDVEDPVPV